MMKWIKKTLLLLVFSSLLAILFAWINPLDFDASSTMEFEGKRDVIIGFNDGYTFQDIDIDVVVEKEFDLINALSSRLSASAINGLKDHQAIRYIDIDQPIAMNSPPFLNESPSWGLERIFASDEYPFELWEETKGQGIKVAVLDTGIDGAHEDLNVVGGYNTISDDPYDVDLNGHGTHVAGIIAGLHNDVGIVGVAPEVSLYSVIVLDEEGSGTTSNLIDGIEWVVANDIPIVNMSIGSSFESSALENAIDEAHALGHIFVSSSGNDGEDGGEDNMTYPAKYTNVIAVGATDDNDTLASYSSYGPELDLLAPGTSIRSTWPEDEYVSISGTSMAAPFVSGVIALMLSVDNSLSSSEILALLLENAEDLGLDSNEQGAGLLRGDWVLNATKKVDTTTFHTITVADTENGTIDPDGTFDVEGGSDVTFTLNPNEGYRVDDILLNGDSYGDSDEFTLTNINKDYLIEVTFTKETYTIYFETFEGSQEDAIDVLYDDPIPDLPTPTLEGHSFTGWYMDENLATAFELETMPAENLVLYAE